MKTRKSVRGRQPRVRSRKARGGANVLNYLYKNMAHLRNDPLSLGLKGKISSLNVISDALEPHQWDQLKTNLLYLATHSMPPDPKNYPPPDNKGYEDLKSKLLKDGVPVLGKIPPLSKMT